MVVVWSVQLAGSYQPYDADVSQRIEAAYAAKDKDARGIHIRGKTYTIAFEPADHMRQILESDRSKQRPVRRTPGSASASAPPHTAAASAAVPPAPPPAPAAKAAVPPALPAPPPAPAAEAAMPPAQPPATPTPAAAKRKRKLPNFSAAAMGSDSPLMEAEAKKEATPAPAPVPAPAPAPTAPGAGPSLTAKRVSKPKADEYVAADDHSVVLTPGSIAAALKHLAQFEELSELALAADAENLFARESWLQAFERMCDFRMRQGKSAAEGDSIVRDLKRRAGGVWSPETVLVHEAAIRSHTKCEKRLERIGTCINLARLFTADPPPNFEAMHDTEVLRSPLHTIHGIGEHTMRRFLLFTLGRPDVLLCDPAGAVNAWLERRFGIPKDQTTAAVERQRLDATQRWRPWRSVASLLILRHSNSAAPSAPATATSTAAAAAPALLAALAAPAAPAAPTAPRAKKFVGTSTLSATVDDVARLTVPHTLHIEPLHIVPGENVVVFRGALSSARATALLQAAIHLSDAFPAPGEGTTGGRGRVCFPSALTTLLHAETRMVRGASARLAASGEADASTELRKLAEQPLTSACGAFLYDRGACLKLHLDDVAACNSNPYDPRVTLWNFGNECHFKWVPATTTARAMWKTRSFDSNGPEHTTTLRHGDALLINVEKIAHGVKVLTTGADDDAKRLLGDRRICVPIRPVADAAYAREHAAFRDAR
jgi:3-methyladenine DNA glycosylase/8-oxoguanine DNA glycosylase